jgi:uncharacterized lipoprotein YajG
MEKNFIHAALFAVLALCLLGGCAADPHAADAGDPYHLGRSDFVAHGEASVSYGHSAN